MSKEQRKKIEVKCEICNTLRVISKNNYQQVVRHNGFYRCAKCSPQRNKEFWESDERKSSHSKSIKSSKLYYEAISKRDQSGLKNGMFGKKHKPETIAKMSKSRTGKIGERATAWKGGKGKRRSFTIIIKGLMQTRYKWFSKVIKRDGSKCCLCDETKNLDAHHIEPVIQIIKRITENIFFENEESKIEFVIQHPDIKDDELLNGMTLCRSCHKHIHNCWGSHTRP